ncbi:hypothetical protein MSAN_01191700 [Mycena sanguinolenta]|uniref:Uncharacterized protein n=1 Tax=Mycena sanguinolenta TaxID=230812 RepID=A0A8H6YM59_9AGAR|nr:hypothetical protein MSAN_01191700 [Mycena sanguinolenta]
MASQSLPVINSVAPTLPAVNSVAPDLPHVAQPAATPADREETPLVSSSSRSMVGQTNASFSTMLGRQASASTDSLINSLLDTTPSAPTTPASKAPAATPIPASSGPASTSSQVLKPAPTGKAEAAASGIRRLDSNMAAVSSRIEHHITDYHDSIARLDADLGSLRNQVKSVVQDATAPSATFSANDMLAHPTVRALITSNNQSVSTIEALRTTVANLEATVAVMREADRAGKRRHDDTTMYSEDVLLPAVKRVREGSDLLDTAHTVVPASANLPTAPPPVPYVDLTSAGAVPDAPPPVSANQNAGVDIGPINWGKDISGQVRGLIARMQRGHTIDADAVKAVYAKRFPKNNKFVTAFFPTNVAAIQFVNAWATAPPPGYEKTSVSFASGN